MIPTPPLSTLFPYTTLFRSIPGCELRLFQPRKSGNMDCTFCLDCAHACPHDNVGVLAVPPGQDLWRDSVRSGVAPQVLRSEEHTSELQSLRHLVCRLLLEKK